MRTQSWMKGWITDAIAAVVIASAEFVTLKDGKLFKYDKTLVFVVGKTLEPPGLCPSTLLLQASAISVATTIADATARALVRATYKLENKMYPQPTRSLRLGLGTCLPCHITFE